MTTLNFTPLYRRSVHSNCISQQVQQLQKSQQRKHAHKLQQQATNNQGFPHYDIVQHDENSFQIVLALAGFELNEIDITVTADKLLVSSSKKSDQASEIKYLHQGINGADFKREFVLAEYVQVSDAEMTNGLLTINLHREVPEALQPRKVAIGTKSSLLN